MLNRFSAKKKFVRDENDYAALAQERQARSFGVADLHIHSGAGDGMASIKSTLDYVQYRTSLNLIAVTDHDMIDGALEAQKLAVSKGYDFGVVVGSEITSIQGHVIALFIEKPIRSLQTLKNTINDIHEQDGLCIIPHPMSWLTRSVGRRSLERVLSLGLQVDGIETFNASVAGKVKKARVLQLNAERYHLAEVGGSDAHFLPHVGIGYTSFEGKTTDDLRKSILNSTTRGLEDKSIVKGKVTISQFAAQQFRSLLFIPARQAKRNLRGLVKGSITP